MAHHGAPTGGLTSAGRSSVWDERGELVLELEPSGPGEWQPLVRMMSVGPMGLGGMRVGQGGDDGDMVDRSVGD